MSNESLRLRFRRAESDFLAAFSTSGDVSTSSETWATLLHDFSIAVSSQSLDSTTVSLAHATASRIAVLADTFLHLHLESEKSWRAMQDDVDEILSHSNESVTPTDSLNAVCQSWLVQHLHDPYPSSTLKSAISERCNVPLKDVQGWFADARRRIGWTALSQEKFNGSRRATSEAASRAYSGDASDQSLLLDVRRAFAAIKANACALSSPQRTSGSLSESQNSPVHTSDSRLLLNFSKEESDEDSRTLLSHPSFHDSFAPSSSITSSICLSADEEEDITPPPPIAGRKRRLDLSTENEEGFELAPLATTRPVKRHRYMCSMADTSANEPSMQPLTPGEGVQRTQPDTPSASTPAHSTTRSSPAPTSLSPLIVSTPSTEATDNISCVADSAPAVVSIPPRKRRLSDASAGNSPKRPRGPISAPRRQVVSDPLPTGLDFVGSEFHTLEEWLQSSFDIPQAIELGDMDYSLPYGVELATIAAESIDSTFSMSFKGPVSYASECHVSDADLVSATPEGFDFSAYNSDVSLAAAFSFENNSEVATSDGSSASSPSSAGSYSELSDYGLPDNTSNVDWTQDWSQFLNILDSLGSSPTSPQSSLSHLSPPFPTAADTTSQPSSDDVTQTLFGVDSSFPSSDLLSDIGGFPLLHTSLEAIF